jgi:poly(3-hydroxybutyrate) depolymerase
MIRHQFLGLACVACACGTPAESDGGADSGDETGMTGETGETGEAGDTGATEDGGDTGVDGGTAGCGLAIEAGMYGLSIMNAGVSRNYWVSIPEGYDPMTKYPLVFAWHGQGGNGSLASQYYGIEEASADAAIFLYPDGLPQALVGGDTGWDLSAGGDDMRLFDNLLDELSEGACVDLERVFSTGHSFGGYMSNALACFRADKVRAIGEVAGGPGFGGLCGGPVAAWMAHDPTDAVVEYSQGTNARDQRLTENGCGTTTSAPDANGCVSYDGCMDGMPVIWCEHSLGGLAGHDWPPFAGDEIWTFFSGF